MRTKRSVTPDHDITTFWPNASPVFLGAFAAMIGAMAADCASMQFPPEPETVEVISCREYLAREGGDE